MDLILANHKTHTNCSMLHCNTFRPCIVWPSDAQLLQRLLLPTGNKPLDSFACFVQNILHLLTPDNIMIHQKRIPFSTSTTVTHQFPPEIGQFSETSASGCRVEFCYYWMSGYLTILYTSYPHLWRDLCL